MVLHSNRAYRRQNSIGVAVEAFSYAKEAQAPRFEKADEAYVGEQR